MPGDYLEDGPMYACFGVCYLDGTMPSLVVIGNDMARPPQPDISYSGAAARTPG
ncbi:hypothetical protein [Streptomyces gossypii]|uniref:hypothetical protein n=1 Tax=Streptomyces gossypii TaxID=2883101 RepID=UPI0021A80AB0|nr:hypothetical protein [Streptomyces gossypii]